MRKGFTLIELLVVVLIMGILASVAMPQYFKSVEKSRSAEGIEVLKSIADAQERYYMKTGSYTWNQEFFDIGISNLSYFTVIYKSADFDSDRKYARVKRKDSAGAGLGGYIIDLAYPNIPGEVDRKWRCSPVSAGCKSFLPE